MYKHIFLYNILLDIYRKRWYVIALCRSLDGAFLQLLKFLIRFF